MRYSKDFYYIVLIIAQKYMHDLSYSSDEKYRYSKDFYYIVLIIAQKYMLFHILVMKNIVICLKGFKVQLFVTN